MKKVFQLLLLGVVPAVIAMDLPKENRLMWNKLAAGFVEVKYNRSTRLESLRTLEPARSFIKRVSTAYFSCGAWNIHSFPIRKDGTDHVPAGFNQLDKFEFRNPQTSIIMHNEHFNIIRNFSLLPDSAIFKYDGQWESLQDNYVGSFFVSFTPEKDFTNVMIVTGDKTIAVSAQDRFNFPQGEAMVYTDKSGRNGFAVMMDQSLYANDRMGAFFSQHGVNFPGYCCRNLKKGETIRFAVYFVLFNDTDPVAAVKAAREKIFGGSTVGQQIQKLPRPVISTGKMLNRVDGNAFWHMAPELLPAESAVPSEKSGKWQIAGAGNEFIAEQLVITPAKELKNFQIRFSDFTGADGKKIPADKFQFEYIDPIPCLRALHNSSVTGEYADRLLRNLPSVLSSGRHHGFLFSGTIPAKTAAGEYSGKVEISADGMKNILPLTIKVHNFALPDRPAYYSDFLTSNYADYVSKDRKATDKFLKSDMAKLRLYPAIGTNVFFDKNGKLTHDAAWVIRQTFKTVGGVQRFRVYGTFRCTKFPKLKDLSPEMDAGMKMFAQAAEKAFAPSGLADKVLWQIGDECHLPDKLKSQIHYSKLTGEVAPKLRRFASINGFNPMVQELIRHTDILAPHTDIFFRCIKDKMDLAGKEIWIYDNDFMSCGIRLSKVRSVAWKSMRYGISGYHQWGVNAWVKNWRPGDDYSGCIYYPAVDGEALPQRSMRLVNFALCVSDYDYLTILKGLIKSIPGNDARKAAEAEFDRILSTVSPAWHEQTENYSQIESARNSIVAMIEKLQKEQLKK